MKSLPIEVEAANTLLYPFFSVKFFMIDAKSSDKGFSSHSCVATNTLSTPLV